MTDSNIDVMCGVVEKQSCARRHGGPVGALVQRGPAAEAGASPSRRVVLPLARV